MDTVLSLGEFRFREHEIPEGIEFGGAQQLVIHKLVGGGRISHAMGRNDDPVTWSGLMTGFDAMERARTLDTLRIAGQEIDFNVFDISYKVMISEFKYTVERFYRVEYTITLEVIEDSSQPGTLRSAPNLNSAITSANTQAQELGKEIQDDPLTNLLTGMDQAIKGVSDFANATRETINQVLGPVSAVTQRVQTLIAISGNVVQSVSTVGGVLPNTKIAQQAARLTGQANALTQLPILYNLQAAAGNVTTNLNLVHTPPSGGRTVTMGGRSLFDVAAQEYGDATKWDVIANANGLSDPNPEGLQTLVIPGG